MGKFYEHGYKQLTQSGTHADLWDVEIPFGESVGDAPDQIPAEYRSKYRRYEIEGSYQTDDSIMVTVRCYLTENGDG